MARWCFTRHNRAPWALVAIALAIAGGLAVTEAQELVFSATLDKTTVSLGDPVTLTLTLSGDMADAELPVPKFPGGIVVVSHSQSTQLEITVKPPALPPRLRTNQQRIIISLIVQQSL